MVIKMIRVDCIDGYRPGDNHYPTYLYYDDKTGEFVIVDEHICDDPATGELYVLRGPREIGRYKTLEDVLKSYFGEVDNEYLEYLRKKLKILIYCKDLQNSGYDIDVFIEKNGKLYWYCLPKEFNRLYAKFDGALDTIFTLLEKAKKRALLRASRNLLKRLYSDFFAEDLSYLRYRLDTRYYYYDKVTLPSYAVYLIVHRPKRR